jgi:NAD-dependent dihydropyrimidine dehydrogenase PreA subunit
MVVITDSCIGCGQCVKYCPVGAISLDEAERRSRVDPDLCVECGTCHRAGVCPVEAIEYPDLPYPRSLRRHFSDPTSRHAVTGMPGRGTEEIKTNDVTGRFERGMVGFCVEVGRPGVGTSIREVERFTRTLSRLGVEYEERNPLTPMFSNREAGEFKEELLDERVLSIIIEFIVPEAEAQAVLTALKGMEGEVNTVFSLGMAARMPENGSIPLMEALDRLGIEPRPNAKINLGMGRLPGGG